jgi:hypothetical protein
MSKAGDAYVGRSVLKAFPAEADAAEGGSVAAAAGGAPVERLFSGLVDGVRGSHGRKVYHITYEDGDEVRGAARRTHALRARWALCERENIPHLAPLSAAVAAAAR